MKKIRNWKVVAEVGDVKVAIDVLKNPLHWTIQHPKFLFKQAV